ncbi:MAG: hypothetical protein WD066_17195 [Planctomycetaceae bacterium]
MNSRTRFVVTLATAVLLTSAYWLYTVTVCPWVAPPSLASEGPTICDRVVLVPPIESRRMAERHLAAQPWTANARYQLRTKEAFVYFQEWDREDDGQAVRFSPFAIIWLQEGKADDEPPITVVCDSAYIRFHSKFEITNNPGRVIAGAFEKDVTITGPDGLWIEAPNFWYNESAMRIWSDNRLRFAYGPHTGDGDGMQIELVPAGKVDPHDSLAVSGVRSVRLRRDVTMNLVGERDEDDQDSEEVARAVPLGEDRNETASGAKKEPERVYVTSAGPFEYFVEQHKAIFEKNVHVRRPTTPVPDIDVPDDPLAHIPLAELPEQNDSLACDRLTLLFKPQEADDSPTGADDEPRVPTIANGAADERPVAKRPGRFSNVESRLAFQQLTAEGKLVHLVSEANDLDATMSFLDYDADRRVVVLKDERTVRVLRAGSVIRSPEITLVHDEEGEVEATVCRGAGWLRYHDVETGEVELAAQWHKQARVFPEAETGLTIIELQERAILKQPRELVGMAAEFIRLWLRKVEPVESAGPPELADSPPADPFDANGAAPDEAPESRRSRRPPGAEDFKPVRALAIEQVAIASPQLVAQTPRLEVWFEEAASPIMPRALPAVDREPRDRLVPAVGRFPGDADASTTRRGGSTQYSVLGTRSSPPQAMAAVNDPLPGTASVPATGSAETTESAPRRRRSFGSNDDEGPQEPVEVIADLIRVRVVENPETGESQVAELWTEGNVNVRQKLGPNQEPRRLTGDRVHFVNKAENQELVHVYGKPAHVRDPRMHIEGPEIHLDRGANRMWVDGAGLLQMPVERTLEGRELAQPEILDIWWKETMTFDGKLALFRGQVRTVNKDNRMRCEEMEVYFDRRVDFSGEEERQHDEDPQIERVICRDGVVFDSLAYEESRLVGIRRGRFWELTIHQQSGDTDARGPGEIVAWSRGGGRRAALGPGSTAQANRPRDAESSEWEYMRIDFAGRTTGNLHDKHTTFHDRVEVVYGPVDRPDSTIDVDHLPRDGGWLRCDSLRFTQREETPEQPAYLELFASGNAQLEGREFHARADQITYDESKGMYLLRGLGNRKAEIWRQTTPGTEPLHTPAQRMTFIPSKNHLWWEGATGLNVVP